jgi:hypothetical protein
LQSTGLYCNQQVSIAINRSLLQSKNLYCNQQVSIAIKRSLLQSTGLYCNQRRVFLHTLQIFVILLDDVGGFLSDHDDKTDLKRSLLQSKALVQYIVRASTSPCGPA